MLMQAEPVYQCYQAIVDKIHTQSDASSELCAEKRKPRVLYMSPQGKTFTQGMAEELAQEEELIFLCGQQYRRHLLLMPDLRSGILRVF